MEWRLQAERGDQTLQIIDQRLNAVLRAHLLGQSEPTLIVTEHLHVLCETRNDPIPRIQRAADLVQQDDGLITLSFELVMKAHAIRFNPRQAMFSPRNRSRCLNIASFATAKPMECCISA